MKTFFRPWILALCLFPGALLAAGGDTSQPAMPSAPRDPVLERVSAATEQNDWKAAQAVLREAIARDPRNAEYHNLYAYTTRKGANPDMNLVFKHYNEALAIDPKHRGAHEYLGEAYLMVGNVAKAKEHLAVLDKLCFFGCSEYTELKNAIGEHEKRLAAK
jgi:cytochrome c-type biogenesis protein CcmH/NrfG